MTVQIRRGTERFVDRVQGRLSRHAFAFGEHYHPDHLDFGPMVCHDDHLLGSGQGFAEHPHSGLEIISWVVSGHVVHRDSDGNEAILGPGTCGVLSAGAGIRHSEEADPSGPARFVQVWLRPDDAQRTPRYATTMPVIAEGAGLVPVAGGEGTLLLDVSGASYLVARIGAGETVTLPAAPRVHAYVATGALTRSSLAEPLQAGDAFLLTEEPEHEITAGVATDLLVWLLP